MTRPTSLRQHIQPHCKYIERHVQRCRTPAPKRSRVLKQTPACTAGWDNQRSCTLAGGVKSGELTSLIDGQLTPTLCSPHSLLTMRYSTTIQRFLPIKRTLPFLSSKRQHNNSSKQKLLRLSVSTNKQKQHLGSSITGGTPLSVFLSSQCPMALFSCVPLSCFSRIGLVANQ